jgi:hypothetical protein
MKQIRNFFSLPAAKKTPLEPEPKTDWLARLSGLESLKSVFIFNIKHFQPQTETIL